VNGDTARRIVRGQRWMNDAEPELGLGIVVDCDDRSVLLHFDAAGESRRYMLRSAPLRRVRFGAGDTIRDDGGGVHRVEAVEEREGLLHYRCRNGEVPEHRLSSQMVLTGPRERLLAARVDPARTFELRAETLARQHDIRRSGVRGLVGPRVELLPHQFFVADEVTRRLLPRVLLADETGLGKTIEAGLVLSRLVLNGRVARALVLVPDALTHQWLVELRRRFQLRFAVFDEERCQAIETSTPGANPFAEEQLVLAGISLVERNEVRVAQAADAGWDIVIVDEAHHLEWTREQASAGYRAVERITAATAGLLLLTATPEQLGEEGHFARLRLLDPHRYADFECWLAESSGYREVASVASDLIVGTALSSSAVQRLAQTLGADERDVAARIADPALRRRLLEELIDRHGPGRVMFRNTRAAVGGFPAREVLRIPLGRGGAERHESAHGAVPDALTARLQAELASDLASTAAPDAVPDAQRAIGLAGTTAGSAGLGDDPRIDWLLELLSSPEARKVVVICRSASKAESIDAAIAARVRVATALFHEGLTLLQRDRNAAWFAQADGARLLVCSELGSEGRNFQHAQHLVLFDVPLDPDLVEQRIGRLDRIGQRGVVRVYVPYVAGSGQEVLVRWLDEGVDAFRRPTLIAHPLLERFGERVSALALAAPAMDPERLRADTDELVAQTAEAAASLLERVEQGRDRLLEMASLRRDVAEPLLAAIRSIDADEAFEEWFLRLLEHFRIYSEEIAPRAYLLNPDAMHSPEFPGLERGETALTFDRHTALVREDLQFATMDHPLLGDAMELLVASEAGNACFVLLEEDAPPRLYLEAVFVLEAAAPPRLHVDRFLAPSPVRVLVDQHRNVPAPEEDPMTPALAAARADGRASWLSAQKATLAPLIGRLYLRCEQLAEESAARLRQAAQEAMNEQLSAELARLTALAAVNDHVRREEHAALEQQRRELAQAIDAARIRLDALRLLWRGPVRDGAPRL